MKNLLHHTSSSRAFLTLKQKAVNPMAGILVAFLFAMGCTTTAVQSPGPEQNTSVITIEAKGTAFLEEAGQLSKISIPKWDKFLEAEGIGFPALDATNPVQKKMTALSAAKYRALAKMVESLRGMEVERTSKVDNMVFSSEEVTITLSGLVKGATTVSETYDEASETATVLIRVAMDSNGNLIPQYANSLAPISIYKRKAEAEEAARISASAALREKIGEAYLSKRVVVEDLQLKHQETQMIVDGLVQGARYSEAKWINSIMCVVTASANLKIENPTDSYGSPSSTQE